MRINNLDESHFNMRANSFSYMPTSMSRAVFQPERSIKPILGKISLEPKEMTLVAQFKSKKDISNLIGELLEHRENIIDINDGYIYKTYITKISGGIDEYWQGWYRLSLPVLVIQCGHKQQYLLNKINNLVINNGNYKCECIYEITPNQDMANLTVGTITIRNLKKNKKVVIDGVLKKVYSDSEPNKYGDCTFAENSFPILERGLNNIPLSTTDAKIFLKFQPIFL